jgi:hypothetical protein
LVRGRERSGGDKLAQLRRRTPTVDMWRRGRIDGGE